MIGKHWFCSILLLLLVPPVLHVAVYLNFYYYGGVIISRLCIFQHSMFEVALNLLLYINSFSFYPFHILTWSSFAICNVFAHNAMVAVICVTTNFGRTNPHLSLTIEIVATAFSMHMVTVNIACKNIEFLEYILVKLCIAVVHLIIQGKKLMMAAV